MIGPHDLAVVVGVTLGVCVLGAATGGALLRRLRGRTIWASVTVVIATATLVMGAAVVALGRLMLVSSEALAVLTMAVALAAGAAALVSTVLARRIRRSSAALAAAARDVGSGPAVEEMAEPDTREMREFASALRAAAEHLGASRQRERAVEAARRELVAWVSHDLRSPVAGLRAMAEALEDGVVLDPDIVAEYHRRMRAETVRLSRMIDDLFDLSGIHAGALVISPRQVDLNDLVDEAAQWAEPIGAGRDVRLVAEAAVGTFARADPDQLTRVLRNLVGNAVRHTPPGGTVVVSAGVRARDAFVAVTDECGGVPAGDLERLFEVGFRGEWARTPGDDVGAGLGLAIAKGIVDAHSGRIEVANAGKGCRFCVLLPSSVIEVADTIADAIVHGGCDHPAATSSKRSDQPSENSHQTAPPSRSKESSAHA